MVGEEDEAAGQVGDGLAWIAYRGFPLVKFKKSLSQGLQQLSYDNSKLQLCIFQGLPLGSEWKKNISIGPIFEIMLKNKATVSILKPLFFVWKNNNETKTSWLKNHYVHWTWTIDKLLRWNEAEGL